MLSGDATVGTHEPLLVLFNQVTIVHFVQSNAQRVEKNEKPSCKVWVYTNSDLEERKLEVRP